MTADTQRNLDASFYSDPSIHEAERRSIFAASWQLIGAEARLSRPGDYIATQIAGVGIFLLRGDDGTLRGFKNVCRHRGAKLVEDGSGNCEVVRCPYHDWHYDTCGALRSTPWFDEATPFDLDTLPLAQIPVKTWRGLVFAALAPVDELDAQLGDLPEWLADTPIENFHPVETSRFEASVNWKTYLDQFVENYHVPRVHAPDKGVQIERYTVTTGRGLVVLAAPAGASYFGGRWIWCWPNWTLSLFDGGMKTSRINPISPRSFEIFYEYYFADLSDSAAPKRRRVIDATQAVFNDDINASALAQVNYSAGAYIPGPLHPRLENGAAYFQKRVRDALGRT